MTLLTHKRRPVIAVPGRFSKNASALRYRALVNATALIEGIFEAGGEPVTILPAVPHKSTAARLDGDVAHRLGFADAVLLPGGSDIDPRRYGQEARAESDAPDEVQDEFDLAVVRYVLRNKVPMLAVCRGMQTLNVALGGDLDQHMGAPHLNRLHTIAVDSGSALTGALSASAEVSCYHHQRINTLGAGLHPTAWAEDGTIEAVELTDAGFWIQAIQWHPEDTVTSNLAQLALLKEFVANIFPR